MRNKLIIILLVFGNGYCSLPDSPRRLSNASTRDSSGDEGFDFSPYSNSFELNSRPTCPLSEDENTIQQLTIVDKLEQAYDKMYQFLFQSQKICNQFNLWIASQQNIKDLITNDLSWNNIYTVIQKEYEAFKYVLDALESDMNIYKPESSRFASWHEECVIHFRWVLLPVKVQCDTLNEKVVEIKLYLENRACKDNIG